MFDGLFTRRAHNTLPNAHVFDVRCTPTTPTGADPDLVYAGRRSRMGPLQEPLVSRAHRRRAAAGQGQHGDALRRVALEAEREERELRSLVPREWAHCA